MAAGALSGVRVIAFAVNLPGPAAAARLQELGAAVTSVLPPGGDPVQALLPRLYDELHEGQETRTIDLKSEDGRKEMSGLLARADVFLTSHRAETLRRLGLDADSVHARHPRVCQVDIVGFAGDRADVPGHDINYQAEAGLLDPERIPTMLVADMHGAERAVSAALAALLRREREGVTRPSTVSLSAAAEAIALPNRHHLTDPSSPLGGACPFYRSYPTANGHVAVGCLEPHFVSSLAAEFGIDPLDRDPGATLAAKFATEDSAHWQDWGEQRGIPITAHK